MTVRRVLLVCFGGMLGTAARLGADLLVPSIGSFPLSTLVVNIVGALLIGVLAARIPGSSDLRVFLGTGILGGFTTYSAFAVDSVEMWGDAPLIAAAYALASLVLGIGAAAFGVRLGRKRPAR